MIWFSTQVRNFRADRGNFFFQISDSDTICYVRSYEALGMRSCGLNPKGNFQNGKEALWMGKSIFLTASLRQIHCCYY